MNQMRLGLGTGISCDVTDQSLWLQPPDIAKLYAECAFSCSALLKAPISFDSLHFHNAISSLSFSIPLFPMASHPPLLPQNEA